MSFQVSDKVVCVDDKGFPPHIIPNISHLPIEGEVYVVRAVNHDPGSNNRPYVLLVGFTGSIEPRSGLEYGFAAYRFRKLSDVKAENAAIRKAKTPKEAVAP